MRRSTDRIPTTHVGSLPHPADLLHMIRTKERGQPYDREALAAGVRGAVADVVRKQAALGVDVVDDGEMGKPGFIHYANERLAGFEPLDEPVGSPWKDSREVKSFPEFYEWFGRTYPSPAAAARHMVCTGPITYQGHEHVRADIANLKAALEGRPAADVFMPSISPTSLETWQRNRYYRSEEEFVLAIAEAMREEYQAIVAAGFILQIDDPHILTHYVVHSDFTVAQVRAWPKCGSMRSTTRSATSRGKRSAADHPRLAVADRERKERELLALLREHEGDPRLPERVRAFRLAWESNRGPEYARVARAQHERFVELVLDLDRTLTPGQRTHALGKLERYAADARTLAGIADPRSATTTGRFRLMRCSACRWR